MGKMTAPAVAAAKGTRRITVLTAYDYAAARLAEAAGIDVLLVGDSLAMVVLGHEDTLSVTMEEMLHHVRAVARGAEKALVVADMPFLSYQVSVAEAVANAGRFLKEGRAGAVKLEGGREVVPQVRAIVAAGIPVLGHVGLTPQHVAALGGFRVQSKTAEAAAKLLEDALALAEAGCFGVVLECIPGPVAARVTRALPVPTIGIGAGPDCDGQVLVFHDVLGLYDRLRPRFVKQYAELGQQAVEALTQYADAVRNLDFPGPEHTFPMDPEALAAFLALAATGTADADTPESSNI
ncbi:3-methyl-2-oxobutanoate hydroxymethyltransferase [Solidesulfovibrio carbinoliphilus subsp. oakridgensis]|uniref:3-methyl-2-oxobutanoate hydroxymethyltransferase n=1 Tax=Solidesulfovibrio carbinoliphilus subsp. oakridgensis TaxID=694327 RepID=G7QDL2_9BACT|nr:3-methyl-2-oxobutanoate hydroxymethyltransferase [Solidesulfovibrio carbinoliphilus]EHJ46518.1 3-methyl-2-oxobutanoate hydroxymethyltransferase [Solidesulfovibrio carbinoliphilus subsp. oakridgensis]